MAGERLVIATHLSDWLEPDGFLLKPNTSEYLEEQFQALEQAGFQVFNVARAIDYKLSKENIRKIRHESWQQIRSCDAFISIKQVNDSELMGKDAGFATALGKIVFMAHSEDHKLKLQEKVDIESGLVHRIHSPLNPSEIREKIDELR
jgi:nucleoside 2-deoxyribosyltransferase